MPLLLPSFVQLSRGVTLPELGVSRHHISVRRPGLRVYVIDARGVVVESRALNGLASPVLVVGQLPVGHICVPLEGTYVARRGSHDYALGRGSAIVDPGALLDERWEDATFRALCIEWDRDHGPVALTSTLRLSPREVEVIEGVANHVRHETLGPDDLDRLFAMLRAHGLPLLEGSVRELPAAPRDAHALAAAVSQLWMRYHQHPDLSDLEGMLGRSARHIRRRLRELGPWSNVPDGDWRRTLRQGRVLLAPSLATARGATVERIAQALGYRSARALLLALREENLPAPSEARALASMGQWAPRLA